jgi:hypothetical protein
MCDQLLRSVLFFCIIVLVGCSQKKQNNHFLPSRELLQKPSPSVRVQCSLLQAMIEAKLVNVPLPFGLKLLDQSVDNFYISDDQVVVGYTVTEHALIDIIEFYRVEMERFGWRQLISFNISESILVFERPGRICIISLRICNNNGCAMPQLWIYEGISLVLL